MVKNLLFAAALLSLALASACAKGGNGAGNGITVKINPITAVGVNLSATFAATVTGTSNTSVAWSLAGTACTGNPNPCGSIDVNTGVYQAPSAVPNPSSITIIATSRADSTARGTTSTNIVPITAVVTPTPVNVGHGLVQQFTATAAPDAAPQTFTWSCTQTGGAACATFVANSSGVAVYTAAENPCNNCITISVVPTADTNTCTTNPKNCVAAKVSVAASRVSGTYALRFSGFDSTHHPVAIAGSIIFDSTGAVAGGSVEDVVINGVQQQYTSLSGSFTPSSLSDNNTNDAGTLTLNASLGPSHKYAAVLDAAGNLRMIQSDNNGTGSGTMEKSAPAEFQKNAAAQSFVFGFTGVDSSGKRVGYAGLLPLDGTATATTPGNITGGIADTNDNGTSTSACASPPCGVTGTYRIRGNVWTMQILLGGQVLDFDFYIGSGIANAKTPLTLYAISTDPIDSRHPMLAGRMVFQDPGTTYDSTALNSFSVSHLTGVDNTGSNTLVSLIDGQGLSNGSIAETFDSNNAGTIVAATPLSPATCTYTTDTNKTGRYIVNMLGTGSSCTGGLPFVLYASGANRGFLLDQSSGAVMTGAMDPQPGVFSPSGFAGPYALGTVSNATSGVSPIVANFLLTSPGNAVFKVGGTQYSGTQTQTGATGSYSLTSNGTGTITLTSPAASYVIYATDLTHFEMIDVDKTVTNADVIFGQQ